MTAIVFEKVFFAFETDGNSLPTGMYPRVPLYPIKSPSAFHHTHQHWFPSFPTGPDCLHSESMQPFSEISGTRGTFGNRYAMTTITLKHFFFGGQFGKHATISKLLDPVEPSPPYQKWNHIILIFVAPIFDGSIFYQKYFLDLIVSVSVCYDIFRIFAWTKNNGYESSHLCTGEHIHPRL